MEYDTDPGVREIQVIKTDVYLGPNEIQTIRTKATHIDEVQVVRTTADNVDEVQSISTSAAAPNGKVMSGWFTVVFDTTARGGDVYTSGPIAKDAPATAADSGGDGTSVEEILEAMDNIGDVDVQRSPSSDNDDGFTWLVTFLSDSSDNAGNVPQMELGTNQLQGSGAAVTFGTVVDGNELGGSFTLEVDGETTVALPHDATDLEVKAALEALATVHTVDVAQTGPDWEGGYAWAVTFTADQNAGDVAQMVAVSNLTGTSGAVTVCNDGSAMAPCQGLSVQGNQISGTFTLAYDDEITGPINYDASWEDVKAAIETMPKAGTVAGHRSAVSDRNGGYIWTVSFTSLEGDALELVADGVGLSGTDAVVEVSEREKGTSKEVQTITTTSLDGTTVSGSFRLRYFAASETRRRT